MQSVPLHFSSSAVSLFSPSPLPTSLFTSFLSSPPPPCLLLHLPYPLLPLPSSCRTVQRQRWTGTSAVPCVTCSSPLPSWPSPTTRAKPTPRESASCWGSRPTCPQPWPALPTQVSHTFCLWAWFQQRDQTQRIQPCTVGGLCLKHLSRDALTMITAVAERACGDRENRALTLFFELAGCCLCVFGPDLKVKAWQVQSISVPTINQYSNDQPCQPWLINTCIGFQSRCLHTEPVLTTTRSYYLRL